MLLLAWGQWPRRARMKFLTDKLRKEGDRWREVRCKSVIDNPSV